MLDSAGFVVAKSQRHINRRNTGFRQPKPVCMLTDVELACIPTGAVFVFDAEVYRNFFFVAFKHIDSGKYVTIEHSADCLPDYNKVRWMFWRYCFVGFNSRTYDMPIIQYAMTGATPSQIKDASDFIIKSGPAYGTKKVTNFDFERKYKIRISEYNHIDLFNVAPLDGSLKLYAGRLHCSRMQDLPFEPDDILTAEDAAIIRPYCCNDLDNTEILYLDLKPQIELREQMGKEYGVDLRSKSDAQMAEAAINAELAKLTGKYPKAPTLSDDLTLRYSVPDYVQFQTPELQAMLEQVRGAVFNVDGLGSPVWPKGLGALEKDKGGKQTWILKVKINGKTYKMGMGGLHSQEKSVSYVAGPDEIIADNDVESFYPRIILNQRLFPPHLGEAFLMVYEAIVNRRLEAKARAALGEKQFKIIADTLKIVINGSFGKLGNMYSTLYAPQLMLQVTITGQLVLLMLIEMLELRGIECVSGNTDGFVSRYHKDSHALVRQTIAEWEALTNFKTEETRYSGIYSRDVNNYIAAKLKFDKQLKAWTNVIEECKVKGVFSEKGSALNSVLSKNPETLICADAITKLIKDGTPIIKTITECKDIRRFVSIGNVRGGGEKNGEYLGKVVRWYYPKNEPGYIAYVGSGNKVPLTDGARPLMDLPSEFPDDVNYDWYIKETTKMMYGCGVLKKATTAALF